MANKEKLMNPIFIAVIHTILHPRRTCPECRRIQIIPRGKRREIIRCKFCGADVPPERK